MSKPFDRPVFTRARRLCLALPETTETSSWSHPNFRVGRKAFCTFEIVNGRPSIAFRLGPADSADMVERANFFATPYGRGLWVSTWVDGAMNWKLIAALVERSYRSVAGKKLMTALDATKRGSPADPR